MYGSAFKFLRLDYFHVTFELRNCVERWFRIVKERTKRFWSNFRSSNWRRVRKFVFWLPSGIILLGSILGLVDLLVMLLNGSKR